jgi:hypothetical protein
MVVTIYGNRHIASDSFRIQHLRTALKSPTKVCSNKQPVNQTIVKSRVRPARRITLMSRDNSVTKDRVTVRDVSKHCSPSQRIAVVAVEPINDIAHRNLCMIRLDGAVPPGEIPTDVIGVAEELATHVVPRNEAFSDSWSKVVVDRISKSPSAKS